MKNSFLAPLALFCLGCETNTPKPSHAQSTPSCLTLTRPALRVGVKDLITNTYTCQAQVWIENEQHKETLHLVQYSEDPTNPQCFYEGGFYAQGTFDLFAEQNQRKTQLSSVILGLFKNPCEHHTQTFELYLPQEK